MCERQDQLRTFENRTKMFTEITNSRSVPDRACVDALRGLIYSLQLVNLPVMGVGNAASSARRRIDPRSLYDYYTWTTHLYHVGSFSFDKFHRFARL